MLGVSAEFTEYRAYRQGDEVRRIDWKLLARSNRAYIRLSNDRTVLSTMLLIDASGSLAYPADSLEKWHFARNIAIGLAAATHRSNDPVGIMVATAEGNRRLPPRTRRSVVYEIAQTLAMITPGGNPELAPILPTLRSAGRVAIISDFLGDADALLKNASQLTAAGREVHAIHILHENEIEPPRKISLLTDPENVDFKRPLTEKHASSLSETTLVRGVKSWRGSGGWPAHTIQQCRAAIRRRARSGASRRRWRQKGCRT